MDPRDINAAFKESRIPYSQLLNLNEVADLSKPKPHTWPTNEIFIKYMKKMDIRKSDSVILYDRVNVFSSPRAFLTFKWFGHNNVRVLNGGYLRYQQLNGDLEKEDVFNIEKLNEYRKNNIPEKEDDFNYVLEENRLCDIHEVLENKENAIIIDARSEERYEGKVQEPRKALRLGHIKGAFNLFFKHLIDENGKYKSNDEIKSFLDNIGIKDDRTVICYCGTGLTACIDIFGIILAGREKNLKLYDGSWFEYGNIPDDELKKLEEKYK